MIDARKDFPLLNNNIIYFDNGATTLKPQIVIDAMNDYYSNYSANAHRGDYDISYKVDNIYEVTRDKVKKFINAKQSEEIIFTKGTTESLNMAVFGYFKNILKENDEVLLTKSEHAANLLPWYVLAKELNIKIKYIELTEELTITLDNVKKAITPNTKVISLAHITNVVGDIRPIKEIATYAHDNDIYLVVDGAQSVGHMKVDVSDLDIDFFAFSAHKMCGPTGIGVLYGKYELLNKLQPTEYGGGMNASFDMDGNIEYKELPHRLEAGTPNIAGVIGLGSTIDYLNQIGMDNIHKHEQELKEYALKHLNQIDNIIIYNKHAQSGIIAFNLQGVFSQDTAIYLNQYNICIRAGSHCAKILKDELKIKNTCRLSFYLYNNKEEIDKLITVLKDSDNIFKSVI